MNVGRTLLSDAFDVGVGVGVDFGLCRQEKVKGKSNPNGVGQECPTHTRYTDRFRMRVPIEQFVKKLRTFPASAFDQTGQIRAFLQESPVDEASLAPYLTWNRQHYTRNLIDKGDLYELIAICWEAGQGSSVHNHRDQMCWMAAPIGKLVVENFRVGFQDIEAGKCRLEASNRVELTAENPCAVDPREPVHRVVNPRETNQRAVSLHVYSRPFDTCVVYSPEQGTCGEIQLHYNTMFGKTVAGCR
jgi:cysteine dioxygenase